MHLLAGFLPLTGQTVFATRLQLLQLWQPLQHLQNFGGVELLVDGHDLRRRQRRLGYLHHTARPAGIVGDQTTLDDQV